LQPSEAQNVLQTRDTLVTWKASWKWGSAPLFRGTECTSAQMPSARRVVSRFPCLGARLRSTEAESSPKRRQASRVAEQHGGSGATGFMTRGQLDPIRGWIELDLGFLKPYVTVEPF
jgi:hypothetical protein